MRLDEYLARIGVERPVAADIETLRRIHIAHLAAFPFTNLDIQKHLTIRLDLDSVERKFLGGGGGYCFEQNTLLAAALREIGFSVDTILARVGSPERRALNHLLLRVIIDGEPWLADVGFGGEGPVEPLPLVEGSRVDQNGITYALRRDQHHWTLSMHYGQTNEDLYEFGDAPHTRGDIEIANHYTATHPDSIFRKSMTIQRATLDERLILRPTMLTRYRGGIREDMPIEPSQLRTLARELFGIDPGNEPLLFEGNAGSTAR
jgi:N-hydroxyarylamine O-acetyltransferase